MKAVELLLERCLLASRWLLVVFLLGLSVALGIYAIAFTLKLSKVVLNVFVYDEYDMILAMLALIDAALVASLIVMVLISTYENFVSRFDQTTKDLSFLGKLDSGTLKLKVASSIIAISSIHLLQVFMNADKYPDNKILWYMLLHLTFVVSAVLTGVLERMMRKDKAPGDKGKNDKGPDAGVEAEDAGI